VRIILNADDFGSSAETVAATVESFERGGLTSASIMPSMPATAEALEFARCHPDYSFGVHLTLTGDRVERPVSSPSAVPGLVDSDGRLLPTALVRRRALLGRLVASELEEEIAAQIGLVAGSGVPVSHVDSHRHLHKLSPVRRALRRVLPRFGVRRVRAVQDVWLRRPMRSATFWVGPYWRTAIAARFSTTDHFYMPASAADVDWEGRLLAVLRRLGGQTLEVGVHPGFESWRAEEQRSALAFAAKARREGHVLISWNAIEESPANRRRRART
jgi:predicted glycoside hydrolase/deacetylase ChbG (UPF0249 family)